MSYMSASDPPFSSASASAQDRFSRNHLAERFGGEIDQRADRQIIAVKEGAGIVPHPFPKIAPKIANK